MAHDSLGHPCRLAYDCLWSCWSYCHIKSLVDRPDTGILLLWGHHNIDPDRLGLRIRDFYEEPAVHGGFQGEKKGGLNHPHPTAATVRLVLPPRGKSWANPCFARSLEDRAIGQFPVTARPLKASYNRSFYPEAGPDP